MWRELKYKRRREKLLRLHQKVAQILNRYPIPDTASIRFITTIQYIVERLYTGSIPSIEYINLVIKLDLNEVKELRNWMYRALHEHQRTDYYKIFRWLDALLLLHQQTMIK